MNLLGKEQFKILERLKTHGALSIDAVTDWTGKPKTAIRRTLLGMEKKGLLERVMQKTERGRPILCFKLGAQAEAVFPTREAEVLSELIQYLRKHGQEKAVESFFSEFWERKYERVMAKISARKCRDLGARLDALKEVLNEDGFYARSSLSQKDGQVTLRECHCPIAAVAMTIDIPCRLEARLIARVLNTECVSAVPMNAKQSACVFKLKTS